MQTLPDRQSRRLAKRRTEGKRTQTLVPARYESESSGGREQFHARFLMLVLGITFVVVCVSFVLLTLGAIA